MTNKKSAQFSSVMCEMRQLMKSWFAFQLLLSVNNSAARKGNESQGHGKVPEQS